MLRTNIKAICFQLLAPHWRATWRAYLIVSLCVPLQYIYTRLQNTLSEAQDRQRITPQVGVLAYRLNELFAERDYPFIEIIDASDTAHCSVIVHPQYIHLKNEIAAYLVRVMPVGYHFSVIQKA